MRKGNSTRGNANITTVASSSVGPSTNYTRISSNLSLLQAIQDQRTHEAQKQLRPWAVTSDRRSHHPNKRYQPPHSAFPSAARLRELHPQRSPWQSITGGKLRSHTRLTYNVPNAVSICLRRKIRREVLMALEPKKLGRSGSKRRRNAYSSISCKG